MSALPPALAPRNRPRGCAAAAAQASTVSPTRGPIRRAPLVLRHPQRRASEAKRAREVNKNWRAALCPEVSRSRTMSQSSRPGGSEQISELKEAAMNQFGRAADQAEGALWKS